MEDVSHNIFNRNIGLLYTGKMWSITIGVLKGCNGKHSRCVFEAYLVTWTAILQTEAQDQANQKGQLINGL